LKGEKFSILQRSNIPNLRQKEMNNVIGKPTKRTKIAAGLFWADYGVLGAQVEELEAGGVDWIHIEMRDGKYMDFAAPRGGYDIIEATRNHTKLEVEVQLQMWRPTMDLYKQLADLGVNLITLPLETTSEMTAQHLTYINDLGLKIGVWAWQGTPISAFEQYVDWVDIIEYECRAPFWKPIKGAQSPHVMDPIMTRNIAKMREMVKDAGRLDKVDIMEDGGLNAGNVGEFICAGMTVGEFSSPLLKGKNGKLKPGTGEIAEAVAKLRKAMDEADAKK
jgi:ribulose-phosphate 3-epimerase